jgi:glutamate dehydrogenase
MTNGIRAADRLESFIGAIDAYEPQFVEEQGDAFRLFARCISRVIDGRYLERHPPEELLPDLEHLLAASLRRDPTEVKVKVTIDPNSRGRRGVLMSCMADQLFIYSVVRLALEQAGVKTYRSLNSIVPIKRSSTGEITSIGLADAPKESFIWIEIEAAELEQRYEAIERKVRDHLQAVQLVVSDFLPMRQVVTDLATQFEKLGQDRPDQRHVHEANARFLRWLLAEHFVFLGMKFLHSRKGAVPFANLGVGRYEDKRGIQIGDAEKAVLEIAGIPPFLWIRKSPTVSWVYRPGQCDHLLVQVFDSNGKDSGLMVIEGLFSFQALAEPRTNTPLLDTIIDQLFAQLKATKGSHRYRTIRNAFNSLPLEYLFTLQLEDVRQLIEQVIDVDVEQKLQTHITIDENQNTAFVFIALPRTHYSDELRSEIRTLLKEKFRAASVDDGVYAGNVDSVAFHFFLTNVVRIETADQEALKTQIEQAASPWIERLYTALRERHDATKARDLHSRYSGAFSARYREATSVMQAVSDIEILEDIQRGNAFECDLYREHDDQRLNVTRLRLFEPQDMLLSDILPVLDNFGLIIIDQFPTHVQVPGGAQHSIATFRIGGVQNLKIDLLSRRNRLREGIRAVISKAMANDPLNRLLLHADIPWTYVMLMRAYQHYVRQLGLPYADTVMQDALLTHADIVRGLMEFFRAKFDPDLEGSSSERVDDKRLALIERSQRAVLTLLEGVEDLTSDEVLRTFYNLIESTVRTNFYARAPLKDHHIAIKLDPSKIRRMPDPRPYREIYVHHPEMAGLHLRGGPVARGGLRWSDRRLDFRTEVLSLMVTQNLKNVLIVPRGAKGGFVLAQPPLEMAERRKAGDVAYKIFVQGLLDVTDNLIDSPKGPQVVHPPRTICHDDFDHYLVVAADKGTAHQSDNANNIAEGRGFWLDDAFASGGSSGYDHKKEGITARGAWECVKRHFREVGMHPEIDAINVVGIGDMSGDVFGNGALLSKSMRLVAAFDHRNIFIDPSPDPLKSYEARLNMFKMPRSSWEDYPRGLLSLGGGIYPRSAKSIPLSKEARAVLGISHDEPLSAPDLVRAILCAPVDLLWNGGIGTYIKATTETHLDVGDPSNDAVRVDATEIRAQVIGEGGNLGITQEGRIELASRGIRLNSDALDNSAGVDLSDHEVNLKILFKGMISRGQMTKEQRNTVLEEIREVVDLMVLKHNSKQSRMVSLDAVRSSRDLPRFFRTMLFLQERVPFKRREMYLPGERIIRQRQQKKEGLFRPELAVLCANAKLDLRQELAKAINFDRERLQNDLLAYFPTSITSRFRDEVLKHPLAKDIACTVLANRLIADVGASFLAEMSLLTGSNTEDILGSYFAATRLLRADDLKTTLDNLEQKLRAELEYHLRIIIEDAVETMAMWLLHNPTGASDTFAEAFKQVLSEIVIVDEATHKEMQEWIEKGTPEALARQIAILKNTQELIDVAQLAVRSQEKVPRALAAMQMLGRDTGLSGMIHSAALPVGEENMDRPARLALGNRLRDQLVNLAAYLVIKEPNLQNVSAATKTWLDNLRSDLAPLNVGHLPLCNLVVAADRIDRRLSISRTHG